MTERNTRSPNRIANITIKSLFDLHQVSILVSMLGYPSIRQCRQTGKGGRRRRRLRFVPRGTHSQGHREGSHAADVVATLSPYAGTESNGLCQQIRAQCAIPSRGAPRCRTWPVSVPAVPLTPHLDTGFRVRCMERDSGQQPTPNIRPTVWEIRVQRPNDSCEGGGGSMGRLAV